MMSNYISIHTSVMALLVIAISGPVGFGQVSEAWVAHYNGEDNDADYARDMEIDYEGNVYAVGTSMSMDGQTDIVTVSFDPSGEERWATRAAARWNDSPPINSL